MLVLFIYFLGTKASSAILIFKIMNKQLSPSHLQSLRQAFSQKRRKSCRLTFLSYSDLTVTHSSYGSDSNAVASLSCCLTDTVYT